MKGARRVPKELKMNMIEYAKKLTSKYAETHKGRNDIERKCIRDGYIILKGNEAYKNSLDEGSYIFALSKNTSGSGKNFVPICKVQRKAGALSPTKED